MAVARLRKRLPAGWDIVADAGSYRVVTGTGWIDAWRLEAVASQAVPVDEDDLDWILAGAPFGELDMVGLVAESTQNLRLFQVATVARFCEQTSGEVTTRTCSLLLSNMRAHPYNDRLAVLIASRLASGGWGSEASDAIALFAETYAADVGELPAGLAELMAAWRVVAPGEAG